ncbi:MAG: hypothetical protein IPG86_06970 [Chitinophagaceae bacterium]|nr:hypothetical protein [Chitinophagaceae bacterium]
MIRRIWNKGWQLPKSALADKGKDYFASNNKMFMNRIKLTLIIVPVLVMMASCTEGSADKKVPELADEMCNCFDEFSKSVSEKEMGIFKEVSTAAQPQKVLTDAFAKLEAAEATGLAEKMKSIGDRNSPVFKCLDAFDKKHSKETTTDKEKLTEKLLKELQSNQCNIGAAIINLSLKKGK